jgi:hypothetical protein
LEVEKVAKLVKYRLKAVFRRRLLKLAKFLRTVKPERFDMGTWVGGDWDGKPDLSCGTRACAMGWATTIPEFRALGLRLGRRGTSAEGLPVFPVLKGERGSTWATCAEKIFGLNQGEASYLFIPGWGDTPNTPKAEARRIEHFANRKA